MIVSSVSFRSTVCSRLQQTLDSAPLHSALWLWRKDQYQQLIPTNTNHCQCSTAINHTMMHHTSHGMALLPGRGMVPDWVPQDIFRWCLLTQSESRVRRPWYLEPATHVDQKCWHSLVPCRVEKCDAFLFKLIGKWWFSPKQSTQQTSIFESACFRQSRTIAKWSKVKQPGPSKMDYATWSPSCSGHPDLEVIITRCHLLIVSVGCVLRCSMFDLAKHGQQIVAAYFQSCVVKPLKLVSMYWCWVWVFALQLLPACLACAATCKLCLNVLLREKYCH